MTLDERLALRREILFTKPPQNFVGFDRELINRVAAVRGSGGIIRISINQSCLLKLVDCLPTDRFTAVSSVILVIIRASMP